MTDVFDDNTLMPFGQYKGKALVNVPGEYLYWLYLKKCDHKQLAVYLEDNKELLKIAYDKAQQEFRKKFKKHYVR